MSPGLRSLAPLHASPGGNMRERVLISSAHNNALAMNNNNSGDDANDANADEHMSPARAGSPVPMQGSGSRMSESSFTSGGLMGALCGGSPVPSYRNHFRPQPQAQAHPEGAHALPTPPTAAVAAAAAGADNRADDNSNGTIPFEVLVEDPSDSTLILPHVEPFRAQWRLCGHGQYGAVYHWRVLGRDIAIKVASTDKGESGVNSLRRERDHLLYLSPHPRIVQICAHYRDQEKQDLHVIMEYVPTTLRDDTVVARAPLSLVFCMLAEGLAYMHSHGVMHRDVKARNVLCAPSQTDSSGWSVKVIDFGLACNLQTDNDDWVRRRVGDRKYRAPETAHAVRRSMVYAPSADVYSFGATIAFCLDQRARLDASAINEQAQRRRDDVQRTPPISPSAAQRRSVDGGSLDGGSRSVSANSLVQAAVVGISRSSPRSPVNDAVMTASPSPPGSPTARFRRNPSYGARQNSSGHLLPTVDDILPASPSHAGGVRNSSRFANEDDSRRMSTGNLSSSPTSAPGRAPRRVRPYIISSAGEMLVAVGETCVQLDPEARPSMRQIVTLLDDLPDDGPTTSSPEYRPSFDARQSPQGSDGGSTLPNINMSRHSTGSVPIAGASTSSQEHVPPPRRRPTTLMDDLLNIDSEDDVLADTTLRLRILLRSVKQNRVGEGEGGKGWPHAKHH
ncbi:protein kinase domain-containing protein [Pseudoscourfieldia marina]